MDEKELNLSERLAVLRTLLAADRSLLAWVRTSLSLTGFGFTIYKFLGYLQEHGTALPLRQQTPRNIGLFLILTGTVPLFFAILQYRQTLKKMRKEGRELLTPGFFAAGIVFLLGALLALSIVLSITLL